MNLPPHATRGYGGEAVTTYTQEHRDRLVASVPPATEVVPVDPDTRFVTEQSEPPIQVGSIRGLFAGIANACIAGAGSAVAVLIAGGSDRNAILSGLALALTLLGSTVSSYAGFAYADQVSRAKKVQP